MQVKHAEAYQHEPRFLDLWEKVSPYTMTGPERGYALWLAVNSVIDRGIPGAFVECGVWKGGSSMLIALTLLQRGEEGRDLYLFDTFAGMTAPGPHDIALSGRHASDLLAGAEGPDVAELVRASAGRESVWQAMASTGYDMRIVRLVEGDVSQTLPVTQTLRTALLRLDTDFYDSTLAELQNLYPRLAQGGILIVDDYGHWQGARRAVHDYFENSGNGYALPTLWPIDYTGRGAVKLEAMEKVEIERYDYVPPGMSPPDLKGMFPHAEPRSPWPVAWPYLRKEVPHIWRCDTRGEGPITGYASVEECACLYTLAKLMSGHRGLEIGTHFGWTAAHLLAAGLRLDCVDPALANSAQAAAVSECLDRVSTTGHYRLWPGASPGMLGELRPIDTQPWSFVFIDGDHDGDAPAADAHGVIRHLAPTAIVVFHDLCSPYVAAGLAVMREGGFHTQLWNTQQILGIAWRGDVVLPKHVSDPNIFPIFLSHLTSFL